MDDISIDFSPLWQTMEEKECSTYKLVNYYGISKGTLDSLKHNRNVELFTVAKICNKLQVPIEKVVRVPLTEFRDRNATYHEKLENHN